MTYVLIPAYTLLFIKGSHLFGIFTMGSISRHLLLCINQSYPDAFSRGQTGKHLIENCYIAAVYGCHNPLSAWTISISIKTAYRFRFSGILYCIVGRAYRQHRSDYRIYLYSLHFITAMSCLFFLLVGIVSTALEVFFSLSCVVLTCNLYKQIKEHNEIHWSCVIIDLVSMWITGER